MKMCVPQGDKTLNGAMGQWGNGSMVCSPPNCDEKRSNSKGNALKPCTKNVSRKQTPKKIGSASCPSLRPNMLWSTWWARQGERMISLTELSYTKSWTRVNKILPFYPWECKKMEKVDLPTKCNHYRYNSHTSNCPQL